MRNRASAAFLALALAALIPTAGLALTPYSQDFELLVQTDPNALANDGWVVFGNVYNATGDSVLYGYGVFPAPNHNLAFSNLVLLEGGPDQGVQQLSIFSDYENFDHANGNLVESNVFQEFTIDAGAVGQTWRFQFDAKMGNLVAPSTALAFIKTIDPANNYWTTNFVNVDMTNITTEWGTYFVDLLIVPELVGQLIQFGFSCTATNYDSSGIIYDNVFWFTGISDVPDAATATLGQNYPNPFNPMTRIDFALEKSEMVDVSVYDLAGRRVATLHRGELGAGDHHVIWDGKSDSGRSVAAGQYRYVLKTASGQTSRSMTLLK